MTRSRDLLTEMYQAAIEAADAAAATRRALAQVDVATTPPASTWIIALGKAAVTMALGAEKWLHEHGHGLAGGIVVAPEIDALATTVLLAVRGDHPEPGPRSLAAADRVGDVVRRVGASDTVLVLLSGGASSLVAAPVDGITSGELSRAFAALLNSGADIVTMNAVRKRFSRWAAGRLASALAPARVLCLVVSDVIGDDLATIASGPCVPDPRTARDVLASIRREGLEPYVTPSMEAYLAAVARGELPETPKPGDPVFQRVTSEVILSNAHALTGAADRARQLGAAPVKVVPQPLTDDAAFAGDRLADELIRFREAGLLGEDVHAAMGCMIWGGETTVHLGRAAAPPGGRCQELALSVAGALYEAGERGGGIALLAAGTDGRDGPTDAAGAIVDATAWERIRTSGRDPDRDLADHDSYAALDSIGALMRVGMTGTNVGDMIIGVVEREASRAER